MKRRGECWCRWAYSKTFVSQNSTSLMQLFSRQAPLAHVEQ